MSDTVVDALGIGAAVLIVVPLATVVLRAAAIATDERDCARRDAC